MSRVLDPEEDGEQEDDSEPRQSSRRMKHYVAFVKLKLATKRQFSEEIRRNKRLMTARGAFTLGCINCIGLAAD